MKKFAFTASAPEQLKQGYVPTVKLLNEMIQRVREIRASERVLYQDLKDIYALSADYNDDTVKNRNFFANVQNKIHYAVAGKTAAEIIYTRVDSEKENIGLTTFKSSLNGLILKSEVGIAKNYLSEAELNDMVFITNMFLDFADYRANSGELIFMKEWEVELDRFLEFYKKPLLRGWGRMRMSTAKGKARAEHAKYNQKVKRLAKG
jgi:hypothetical protein